MTKAKDVRIGDSIKTNLGLVMVDNNIQITKTKNERKRYCFSGFYTLAPKWVVGKKIKEDRFENTKVDILKGGK